MISPFKILVVDDSQSVREMILQELNDPKFEVHEVSTGKEVIVELARLKPDLVTLDVELDDINGYEICRQIRGGGDLNTKLSDKISKVPVVFLTNKDEPNERKKGFFAGATEFIVKPFLEGELRNSLIKILEPDRYFSKSTILVAEDSKTTRLIIRQSIEQLGGNVLEAADGHEAARIIHEKGNTLDLIITDYEMPEVNGYELIQKIRSEYLFHSIPIIFLTAVSELEYVNKCFRAGATDYIIKPFSKEVFINRIKVQLMNRHLIRQLKQNSDTLKKAYKEKTDFLATTAHDLRSPLTTMLGFASLLESEPFSERSVREYARYILRSGEQLLVLLEDVMTISRQSLNGYKVNFGKVDISTLSKGVASTFSLAAESKNIALETEIQPDIVSVSDPMILTRLFNNIFSNAVKFTNQGGKIIFKISLQDKKSIKATLIDNGIGMSPEQLSVIYEKHTPASRAGTNNEPSTGLGMYITKTLTRALRGTINIESQPGKGTSVQITVPFKEEAATEY